VTKNILTSNNNINYDVIMRTTLTLDPDVSQALKPLLSRSKLKPLINDLLRSSLGINKKKSRTKLPTYSLGLKRGIDPVSLNKLYDEESLNDFK